jgi:hypothetical protein
MQKILLKRIIATKYTIVIYDIVSFVNIFYCNFNLKLKVIKYNVIYVII